MRRNGRWFATLGFAAGMVAFSTAVAADELLMSGGAVDLGVLDQMRGGDIEVAVDPETLAASVGIQNQEILNNFAVTGDVYGGNIEAGSGTFQNQVMSLNVINTGNNVAVQTQNVIAVNIVESMVTLP